MRPETIALHAGYQIDPTTKAVAVPIYQTTSYAFDNTQHGADLFNLEVAGNIYTRIMNPTTAVLEARLAELEGGIAALCVASGMAAGVFRFGCTEYDFGFVFAVVGFVLGKAVDGTADMELGGGKINIFPFQRQQLPHA